MDNVSARCWSSQDSSFKVSASISKAATSRLGKNFDRLSLEDMGLRSRIGPEGLVHIPEF